MQGQALTNRWMVLLVILAIMSIYFWNLSSTGFVTPGEPRYAEIAKEMVLSNNYLIPKFNGQVHLEKPPGLYWLTAFAFKIFGFHEWSARLIPVISALLTALFILFIAVEMYANWYIGINAALILLSSLGWFIFGRFLLTDIVSILLQTIALWNFLKYKNTYKKSFCYGLFIFLALGAMVRGLLALVFPLAAIFIFIILQKDFKLIWRKEWLGAFLVFWIIFLPWHVLVEMQYPGFLKIYFLYNHVGRFLGQYPPGGNNSWTFWPFLGVTIAGFFPWSFFLVGVIQTAIVNRKTMIGNTSFGWVWGSVTLFFIFLSNAKLERYFLPALPPLSLIVADYFYSVVSCKNKILTWIILCISFLAIIGVGIGIYVTPIFRPGLISRYDSIKVFTWVIAASYVIAGLGGIGLMFSHKVKWLLRCLFILMLLSFIWVRSAITVFDDELTSKKIATFINNHPEIEMVVVENSYQFYEGINYYADRQVHVLRTKDPLVEDLARWDGAMHPLLEYQDFEKLWRSNKSMLLITKDHAVIDGLSINSKDTVYLSPFWLITNKNRP